jgi:hypothetical protein
MIGGNEAAVSGALEQHHLIGPQAEGSERLAKTVRHRAEVLADDDALAGVALLRDRGELRRERKADIGALVGAHSRGTR